MGNYGGTLGRDTWAGHFSPYRRTGSVPLLILLFLSLGLWLKPQIGHAVALCGADELLILSPIQGAAKPLTSKFSFLLGGVSLGRRAGVKGSPHQVLIHHPHHRAIRRD